MRLKTNKIAWAIGAIALGSVGWVLFCMQSPSSHSPHNTIKSIDSFTQAADSLATATPNSLVLFDVREVLYVPSSALFHVKVVEDNTEWLKALWKATFQNAKQPEEYYMSIWKRQETPMLIEPSIAHTIASLQERDVKVMVLTSLMSGADFTIPSLPEWRFDTLKKLGLDFRKAGFPDMVFQELPEKKGQHPRLFNGILIASGSPKGQVLGTFLDRAQFKPDKVIFFDDSMERVESVAQEMKKRSIPFYGYQYNGARFVPGALDKEIAALQLKHLVAHDQWLTEDEVRATLAQK